MEEFTGLILICLILFGIYRLINWLFNLLSPDSPDIEVSPYRHTRKKNMMTRVHQSRYKYTRKKYIMTQAESHLFRRLESIAGSKYYIFPQIHLSSILDHQVYGQDWRAALARIQRKSVDFVLVNKQTLTTSYAIELDDKTHDATARITRDDFVDEIFSDANVTLVRFRNITRMSDQDITQKLQESSLQTLNDRPEITQPQAKLNHSR